VKVQSQKNRGASQAPERPAAAEKPYSEFERINGEHSFKSAVPDGAVEYHVRTRHGGRVVFFNFPLAKEMGLIPDDHPETMNDKLERKLLETFSLVIINEYDIRHKIKFPEKDIRPNRYMATRYLQLQHKDKRGKCSGDGRGIWNGEFKGLGGTTWDVTSSGTGATRLSPAASETGRFFRTGDKRVGYGNGYNTLDEGLSAALMSEIFHQNGIGTERTLVLIGGFSGDEEGTSINVRAGHNLIRPSHFFCHLKQGRHEALKAAVDYYFDRQVRNAGWPKHLRGERKYAFFAEEMARVFARLSAVLENEYIFCWMDWDGDNILADGGIIDYGSVRQFGLFYGEYRYDDVDRFSTRLPEQRHKARYIVQCFAQIRDFLNTGRKRAIGRFKNDPVLKIFDQELERRYLDGLLERVGYGPKKRDELLSSQPELVRQFRRAFNYLERVSSKKGVYELPDGLNRDAVFSMRDLLREYPARLQKQEGPMPPEELVRLMAARQATAEDLEITEFRAKRIAEFQSLYAKLVAAALGASKSPRLERKLLLELTMRSSIINRSDRITGDSAILVTENFIRWHKRLQSRTLHEVFRAVVDHQDFRSDEPQRPARERAAKSKTGALVQRNLRVIRKYSESV
jgi:uncharacterized protein YdiU (UPF0061 family)